MAEVERPSGGTRPLRPAQSIRLPFWLSVAAFLAIAIVAAALLGRPAVDQAIPPVVADYQRGLASEMAQNVRRGLNEGVADLEQTAAAIDTGRSTGRGSTEGIVEALRDAHDRYDEVAVLDADGRVALGERSSERALATEGPAGIAPLARFDDAKRPLIEQFAPLNDGGLLVARYDPEFLKFALSAAGPGDAWLIDRDGRILSSTTGYLPYASLPGERLREGAAEAARGVTGASSPGSGLDGSVVAWAPVTGEGPGGQLGVSVVTNRDVGSLSLPATDARREGLVVAVLIAIFTVLVFSWLWIIVVVPAQRLRDEAERVARGDFSASVAIIRYDEIGLISRATDRLRILLIGARVPGAPAERVRSRQTPARKAAVALAVVVAFAGFTALLVEITTLTGGTGPSRDSSVASARSTTTSTTSTTSTPSTTAGRDTRPEVSLEAVSCIRRGETLEYTARLSHGEANPVQARLVVTFRNSVGEEAARNEATVMVPPDAALPVSVSASLPPDFSAAGATCAVAALEVLEP